MSRITQSLEQFFWMAVSILLFGVETMMALCSGRFRYAWNNIVTFPAFCWGMVAEWWMTTICS